jgi:hypothetical protein
MSDYGEKLLRLLVAETHCLVVLLAAQGMANLTNLSDEKRTGLEEELARWRIGYTNLLTPKGVDELLTPLPERPQSIH